MTFGVLLPSLCFTALGAIMVGSSSQGSLLWRATIEQLAIGLGLVGSVTMAFVVVKRSRRSMPMPSIKATVWLTLWPIPTGLLLLGELIVAGVTLGLIFVIPFIAAAFGAWIPVAAVRAITAHRRNV